MLVALLYYSPISVLIVPAVRVSRHEAVTSYIQYAQVVNAYVQQFFLFVTSLWKGLDFQLVAKFIFSVSALGLRGNA